MPSLPEVTEDFVADGTQFIATLLAIADAADRAAAAVAKLQALEKGLSDALTGQAAAATAAAAGVAKSADADNKASLAAAELAAKVGDATRATYAETLARDEAIRAGLEQTKTDTELAAAELAVAAAAGDVRARVAGAADAIRNYTAWQQGAVAASAEATAAVTRQAAAMQILGYSDYQAAAAAADQTKAAIEQAAAQASVADAVGAARDRILSYAAADYVAAAAATKLAIAEAAAAAALSGVSGGSIVTWLRAVKQDTIGALAATNGLTLGFRNFTIGWTALHWILAGTFELLAVLVPAMVALGAGLAVAAQGASNVQQHMQALYTATEATHAAFGKTAGDVLGLGHALQSAQDAANPGVYEVLGAALNILKGHMGALATAGLDVVHMFDQFSAKVTMDMQGAMGAQIQGLLSNMVTDLQRFGQILGNIGHALLNFASDMPGLAQMLLLVADGISKVILFASQGGVLITMAMGLEEMYRWGGLVLTLLVRLTGQMAAMEALGSGGFVFRFGAALATLANTGARVLIWAGQMVGRLAGVSAAFGTLGTGIARAGQALGSFAAMGPGAVAAVTAAAVAVGYLLYKLITFQDATQKWAAASSQIVAKASDMQVLSVIGNQLAQTTVRLSSAQQHLATVTDQAGGALGRSYKAMAIHNVMVGQAAQDVGVLTQHEQQLIATGNTVRANIGFLATVFGTTRGAALALANAAGVNLQQAFYKGGMAATLALVQIRNLETGLGAMSAPAGVIGNDMAVLGIQSQLAASRVQQLNQAWDQWIASVTGGMQAMAQFETALSTMQADVAGTSATLAGAFTSIGTSASNMTYTLKGFGPAAMQSWQQFTSAIQQGNTVLDQLRMGMAEGVVKGQLFGSVVRGMVGQMAPFTQGNAAAVAMLRQLAAEAGGPATGSLRQLERWAGVTGTAARNQLGRGMEQAAVAMSKMGTVANNLSAILGSRVNQAMANAIFHTSGLSAAVAAYTRDANAAHPSQAKLHQDIAAIAAAEQVANTQIGHASRQLYNQQQAAAKTAAEIKHYGSVTDATTAHIAAHITKVNEAAGKSTEYASKVAMLSTNTATMGGHVQAAGNNIQTQGQHAQTASQQVQALAKQVLTAGGYAYTAAGKMASLALSEAAAGKAAATAAGQVHALATAIASLQNKTVTVTYRQIGGPGVGGSPLIGPGSAGLTGHAAGTMNAAPGLAWVGERGPELMLFGGGEQVFSASQAAAILSMARQPAPHPAAPAGNPVTGIGGGEPFVIHNVITLDGETLHDSMQPYNFQYSRRNSGATTGLNIPGSRIG